MKQVVQSVSRGELKLVDVPQPVPGPTEVLVATRRSLLSAGTEKAVRQLASANLLQKAKARPDLVRQVIKRARSEGIASTVAAVRSRLDDEMPLGYSAAGVAVSVGEYVTGVRPGMRVATASAGHGEYQLVPGLLSIPIPEGVSDESAAFGAVAAIALQGLRQADVGVGGTVCVIGLGLVGQLTVRLALASGLTVIGIDLSDWTAQLATKAGALGLVEQGHATTERVREATRGRGVDAVLLTAATSSSQPMTRATEITRDRGRLVVVGDIGLQLDRRPYYEQELEIRFARSYGPGRYERSYEEWGVDLPAGHVRWTEGRNIEAFLDLLNQGRLVVDDLVTHTFEVERAAEAYQLMESKADSLAIQLSYSRPPTLKHEPIALRHNVHATDARAGIIGAGHYARATFLPALVAAGWGEHLVAIASSKGLTSRHLAETYKISNVVADADAVASHPQVDMVFVLSRHDSHAALVIKALDQGKHVFVEKPLALSVDELAAVTAAYARNDGGVYVGFNRRYSQAMAIAQSCMSTGTGPITINYRVNAGKLPESHWYNDRRQGGRLIGEVCHYVHFGQVLIGHAPQRIAAFSSGKGEAVLDGDYQVTLVYPEQSTLNITYTTSAHSSTPKEQIEIFGRDHTVTIRDFHTVHVDGKEVRGKKFDKGHGNQLRVIRAQLLGKKVLDEFATSVSATSTMLDIEAALLG